MRYIHGKCSSSVVYELNIESMTDRMTETCQRVVFRCLSGRNFHGTKSLLIGSKNPDTALLHRTFQKTNGSTHIYRLSCGVGPYLCRAGPHRVGNKSCGQLARPLLWRQDTQCFVLRWRPIRAPRTSASSRGDVTPVVQCLFYSRNIGQFTPTIVYFLYLKKYFPDRSIPKMFL